MPLNRVGGPSVAFRDACAFALRASLPMPWLYWALRSVRYHGTATTSVSSVFPLRDELPSALADAEIHRQRTDDVPETAWIAFERDVRRLIRTAAIDACVPIVAISGILNSKSFVEDRVRYRTIHDFGQKVLGDPDIAAKPMVALLDHAFEFWNDFEYLTWSRRLLWNNSGGSHHLAAAAHRARYDMGTSYSVDARVNVRTVDAACAQRLAEGYFGFLEAPEPSNRYAIRYRRHRDLESVLRDIVPYRTASLQLHGAARRMVVLPKSSARAARVGRWLRERLPRARRDVFETLLLLSRERPLPPYLG
jgi:Family of unknown function (DUF6685)